MAEPLGGQQFGDVMFGDTGIAATPGGAIVQNLIGQLLKLTGEPAIGVLISVRPRRRQIISGAVVDANKCEAVTGIDGRFSINVLKGSKVQVQVGTYVVWINITNDDEKDIATYTEVF